MIEVPTFVKGEPGFAAKLNQLGDAVREVQAAVEAAANLPAEAKPKRATRAKPAPVEDQ